MVALMLGAALTVSDSKAAAAQTSDKAIADIQRYCSACWRNARIPLDSWTDCTQEVLCRLMQRIPLARWDMVLHPEGEERREFVRAIDAVKKRTQRSRKWSALNEDVTDRRGSMNQGLSDRREELNRAAEQVLSVRQRRILQMSVEGYTVQDMADTLTMSPERVSDEKYKAIRKLRRELGVEI
jgi:RNA polymerase sigma factor (sigma-70 family)